MHSEEEKDWVSRSRARSGTSEKTDLVVFTSTTIEHDLLCSDRVLLSKTVTSERQLLVDLYTGSTYAQAHWTPLPSQSSRWPSDGLFHCQYIEDTLLFLYFCFTYLFSAESLTCRISMKNKVIRYHEYLHLSTRRDSRFGQRVRDSSAASTIVLSSC